MNGLESAGKLLLIAGAVLALLGLALWGFSKLDFLGHLGHLPGDVRIERPGFSLHVPLGSMLLLSVALTVIVNLVIQIVRLLTRGGPR